MLFMGSRGAAAEHTDDGRTESRQDLEDRAEGIPLRPPKRIDGFLAK